MQSILRVLIIVALLISLAANMFMYQRWRNRRTVMNVNAHNVTQQDVYDYLTNKYGENVKLEMVERYMIEDEAQKKKLAPSNEEVQAQVNDTLEKNWQMQRTMAVNPWKAQDLQDTVRQNIEIARLLTADVPVTPDQIKEEYNAHPQEFDTPAKAYIQMALLKSASNADNIKKLMTSGVSVDTIGMNYREDVVFLGSNTTKDLGGKDVSNVFLSFQPFGTQINQQIFSLKPNDVVVLPPPQEFVKQGISNLVVRMIKIEPGKKADLNDPKTKERLTQQVAAKRAQNTQEYLLKLWGDTDFRSEDPRDKDTLQKMLSNGRK